MLPSDATIRSGKVKIAYSGDSALGVTIYTFSDKGFHSIVTKSGPSPIELDVPSFEVPVGTSAELSLYAMAQGQDTPVGGAFVNPRDVRPAPVLREVPYKFDATIPAYFEACAFPAGCFGTGGSLTSDELKFAPVSGVLTMTWSAASPATESLEIAIGVITSSSSMYYGTSGSSPLKFDLKSLAVPAGAKVVVDVYVPGEGVFPAYVSGTPMDQPVSIAGTWKVPS
jgi:hypothetical protein